MRALPAVTESDKERFALFRKAIPYRISGRWQTPHQVPMRTSDYDKPGQFAKLFTDGTFNVQWRIDMVNIIVVTVSRIDHGRISDADLLVIALDFKLTVKDNKPLAASKPSDRDRRMALFYPNAPEYASG
jgi:hypothetical protein